jgi:two-component system nitrate/nitrite response regulator NarP
MDVLARAGLKESEARIAALVCEGLTNRQIGRACGLTEGTVKVYLHRIYPKLSVNSKSGLAAKVTTLRISVEASSDTK